MDEAGVKLSKTFEVIKTDISFDELIDLGKNVTGKVLTFNNETLILFQTDLDKLKKELENITATAGQVQTVVLEITDTTTPPDNLLCQALLVTGPTCAELQNSINDIVNKINTGSASLPTPDLSNFYITNVSIFFLL